MSINRQGILLLRQTSIKENGFKTNVFDSTCINMHKLFSIHIKAVYYKRLSNLVIVRMINMF